MPNRWGAPIFVRGLSRSGGTLVVTLLDAHRDVAMSYELYPNLLESDDSVDETALAREMAAADNLRVAQKRAPTERFGLFVVRCERGGLDNRAFAAALRTVLAEGLSLKRLGGRMRMIELCGVAKAIRAGKSIWGMKLTGGYEDYLAAWPNARFINVLRDGRDVLASQINSTRAQRLPQQVAKAWLNTHERFERLVAERPHQAYVIRYENLAHQPEKELRTLCEFLDLEWDDALLRHHQQDLTVFNARHISRERVASPIDTAKIGRWRNELKPDELAAFLSVAQNGLWRFGYS
jgi:Sulfotransferase family